MSNVAKRKRGGIPFGVPFPGAGRPNSNMQQRRFTTDFLPVVNASRVAPTFIEMAADTWSGGGASRTAALTNVQNGDTIIVVGVIENHFGTINTPTGGSLTYNPGPGVPGVNGWGIINTWTTTATATGALSISCTMSGITGDWNVMAVVFRGSEGPGNTASRSMADGSVPSISLATVASKSVVFVFSNDWNAGSVSGRTYLTVNSITPVASGSGEIVATQVVDHYTVYGAYWSDVGNPGSSNVFGLSAPGSQKPILVAIEIRGAESPPPTQIEGWGMLI